jgi:thiol peroxidase
MAKITHKGIVLNTSGNLPPTGKTAHDFSLVKRDLSEMKLSELKGKRVVMNIFPSLDTSVCATSVRTFNKKAAGLQNTVVLAISKDLPFAMNRFCTTEGIDNVIPLSAFRNHSFGKDYGVEIMDGAMAGLLARSVVVVDVNGKVIHTELVPEIAQEPNYEAALAIL